MTLVYIENTETKEVVEYEDGTPFHGSTVYYYQEGNGSCDCNRHLFFWRTKGFEPDLDQPCGQTKYRIPYLKNGVEIHPIEEVTVARGKKKTDYQGRARTYYQSEGYIVETLERKNCWTGFSHDFLGIGDLMAIHPETHGVIIIQATSGMSRSAHIKKMKTEERNGFISGKLILEVGFKLHLVTYSQLKATGRKWIQKIDEFTLSDFA